LFNIIITGSVNLAFTFVAIYTVDKIGRRILMLIGAGGLGVIYILLGTSYFFQVTGWPMMVLIVSAIACFAMTFGPVMWVILAEIFPNRIRGAAMAVGTMSLWIACFLLTYTFPILNDLLSTSGTFLLYAAICLAGFVFVYKKLPETKGKSLEELESQLIKHKN
jgi:SP family sugar porter-like MFS transporter